MIKAALTTDDNALTVILNAEPHFKTLTPEEILNVIDNFSFSCGDATDQIAINQQGKNHKVDELFQYLGIRSSGLDDPIGYHVTLDENHAVAWILKNHPQLLEDHDVNLNMYDLEAYEEDPVDSPDVPAEPQQVITDMSKVLLVYVDSEGAEHWQPVADLTHQGGLIDPYTGDDMEVNHVLIRD